MVFVDIAGDDASGLVGMVSQLGPLAVSVAALAMLVQVTKSDQAKSIEWGALIMVFVLAPPVLAFAVYFAFLHSARHLEKSRLMVSKIRNGRVACVVASAVTRAVPCSASHGRWRAEHRRRKRPISRAFCVDDSSHTNLLESLESRTWINRRLKT